MEERCKQYGARPPIYPHLLLKHFLKQKLDFLLACNMGASKTILHKNSQWLESQLLLATGRSAVPPPLLSKNTQISYLENAKKISAGTRKNPGPARANMRVL